MLQTGLSDYLPMEAQVTIFQLPPVLYFPQHLRRWRAAYALADRAVANVVMAGDSIFYGIGADNTNTTSAANAVANGICGRLQGLFNSSPRTLQTVNQQGFISAFDSRVTAGGAPAQNFYAVTALGQGYRLIANTQTLTLTVPAGVTQIGVVQGNSNAAFNTGHSNVQDVTGLYSINGGSNTSLGALTNTNLPVVTTITGLTGGNTLEILGPATAQTYISGFILGNGAANGVQVHRACLTGLVSGALLGGQENGALENTTYVTTAAQANYYYANSAPGVIIVEFGFNDQQFQNGSGGVTQNGVNVSLYQQWIQQFASQAVADGWCVLLMGSPRNIGYNAGYPQLDQYFMALYNIASATDHVAYIDVGQMWGGYAYSQADGLQVANDEHPNEAGHGDIAAMLWMALNSQAMSGITELTAA